MKKEKEPKPKKPKKEKRPKKGAEPAENPENGEEGKGKKKKLPILFLIIPVVLIAVAAALVIFVIKPFGDKEPADDPAVVEPDPEPPKPILPKEYVMNGVSIAALTSEDMSAKAWVAKTVTYTYTGLSDAGATVSDYVKQLTSSGYSVVDEGFVKTDSRPDFTAAEGTVLMARNKPAVAAAPQEPEEDTKDKDKDKEDGEAEEPVWQEEVTDTPKVVTVRVSWTEGSCVVTADEAEGTVTSPPGSGTASRPMISMDDALDIMRGLSPADLGLSGESMEDYRIYVRDGSVLVDGRPCMYLSVYDVSDTHQTNEVAGTFLMTNDGTILYRLNPETNRAERVNVDLTSK